MVDLVALKEQVDNQISEIQASKKQEKKPLVDEKTFAIHNLFLILTIITLFIVTLTHLGTIKAIIALGLSIYWLRFWLRLGAYPITRKAYTPAKVMDEQGDEFYL